MVEAMLNRETTEELVRRAREGDREAFEALSIRFAPDLRRAIAARVGMALRERLDPEDVLQEAFLRALGSIACFQWRGEESFLRWLRQIAEHRICDAAKGRALRTEIGIDRDVAGSSVSSSRAARREERLERLERALRRLSPDHSRVIRLARIDGLKIHEVAERMGRSESAVKSLLLRALRELKETFGETDSLGLPDRGIEAQDGPGEVEHG
jgi:RNA polymerase sigma-70 factor (ECF subfamily)